MNIEPALTPEAWKQVEADGGPLNHEGYVGLTPEIRAYLIALNNAALPRRRRSEDHAEDG